jgi:hypothetical protein
MITYMKDGILYQQPAICGKRDQGTEPVLILCTHLCSPVPEGLFPSQLAGFLCNYQSGDISLHIHLFPFKHISAYNHLTYKCKMKHGPMMLIYVTD